MVAAFLTGLSVGVGVMAIVLVVVNVSSSIRQLGSGD